MSIRELYILFHINKALVFSGELLRSAGVRGNQDEVLLSATGRKVAAVLFLQIRYQILW